MSKTNAEKFTNEEVTQRRDAIVRAMVNMTPQPRAAKRPAKSRGKAIPTASDREPRTSDASAKNDAAA